MNKDSTCQNTAGSFICVCNNGFKGSEFLQIIFFHSFRISIIGKTKTYILFGEKIMVLDNVKILMNVLRRHVAQMHTVMILWDHTFVIVFLDTNKTAIEIVSTSMNAK